MERSVCQRAVGGEGLGSGGGRRRVRNGERVRCVCSTRAIVREDYLPIVCRSLALSLSTAAQPPLSFSILHRAQALFRGFCATREERRLRSREISHTHTAFPRLPNRIGTDSFRIVTKIVTSRSIYIYI